MIFICTDERKLTGFFQYSVCEYRRETIDHVIDVFRKNVASYLQPEDVDVATKAPNDMAMVI